MDLLLDTFANQLLKIIIIIFCHSMWHTGSLFPNQGLNPCSMHWEYRVLTTGPLGKPLEINLKVKDQHQNWLAHIQIFMYHLELPHSSAQTRHWSHGPIFIILAVVSVLCSTNCNHTSNFVGFLWQPHRQGAPYRCFFPFIPSFLGC